MSLPTFDKVLRRADESALQALLGQSTLRLMRATLGQDFTTSRLRDVLLEIRPPWAVLADDACRELILSMLSLEESRHLAERLELPACSFETLARKTNTGTTAHEKLLDALVVQPEPIESGAEDQRAAKAQCTPRHGLFEYQRTAVLKTLALLDQPPHRAMLHMPTGSGKTRTAMQIAAAHLRRSNNATVLWLATSEELCEQAASEFIKTWEHVGDHAVDVVAAWGNTAVSRELLVDDRPKFVIAGLAKLYAASRRDPSVLAFLGDKATLVIFDEAHQAIAPTYSQITEAILARRHDSQFLGLSATPGRTWNDRAADSLLSHHFSNRKVTLSVSGYSNPVQYLIEKGFLAKPSFVKLPYSQITHTAPREELTRIAEHLDVPEELRNRFANDDIRNLAIIRACQNLSRNHRRFLLFAATVDHCNVLAANLRALGVMANSVTSKTPSAERSRLIRAYQSGSDQTMVLVNFGILTTGFDAPKTSAAVIARPTTSLVLYSQMAGRALRGPRAGGNAEAEIVTVVDPNLPGFGNLEAAFNNWEDVW